MGRGRGQGASISAAVSNKLRSEDNLIKYIPSQVLSRLPLDSNEMAVAIAFKEARDGKGNTSVIDAYLAAWNETFPIDLNTTNPNTIEVYPVSGQILNYETGQQEFLPAEKQVDILSKVLQIPPTIDEDAPRVAHQFASQELRKSIETEGFDEEEFEENGRQDIKELATESWQDETTRLAIEDSLDLEYFYARLEHLKDTNQSFAESNLGKNLDPENAFYLAGILSWKTLDQGESDVESSIWSSFSTELAFKTTGSVGLNNERFRQLKKRALAARFAQAVATNPDVFEEISLPEDQLVEKTGYGWDQVEPYSYEEDFNELTHKWVENRSQEITEPIVGKAIFETYDTYGQAFVEGLINNERLKDAPIIP